eukprot:gene33358-41163_t
MNVEADFYGSIDQIIKDEFHFRLICLFKDCDELLKIVSKAWIDVRNDQITFFAATAATLVAMKQAEAMINEFQMAYSAIQNVDDIFNIGVFEWLPKDTVKDSRVIAVANLREGQHSDGALYFDFLMIGEILSKFTQYLVGKANNVGVRLGNAVGQSYNETMNPIRNYGDIQQYLLNELSLLHENHVKVRLRQPNATKRYSGQAVLNIIMGQFETAFDAQQVSLGLVFSAACWIKSVVIMQGEGRIGRVFSLTKSTLVQLQKTVAKSEDFAFVGSKNPDVANNVNNLCVTGVKDLMALEHLYYRNPLLSGTLLLNIVMRYLDLSCQAVHACLDEFRMVMHLYNACVKLSFLKAGSIPLLEMLAPLYERLVFAPHASGPRQGAFLRCFKTSLQFAITPPSPPSAGHVSRTDRSRLTSVTAQKVTVSGGDFSQLYRILVDNDLSAVYENTDDMMEVLAKVIDITLKAQTEPPYPLGFSLLTTCDSFMNALGGLYARFIISSAHKDFDCGEPEAVEAVTFALLNVLDNPSACQKHKTLLKLLANEFAKGFEQFIRVTDIFYIREDVNMFSQSFGSESPSLVTTGELKMSVGCQFKFHLDTIKRHFNADTQLSDEELGLMKHHIKEHPVILGIVADMNTTTLLSLAVWSPAFRDDERFALVDWMVQMGGNRMHNVANNGCGVKPIHRCVIHNKLQCLKILMNDSNFHDIEFVTGDGDTCLSLASQYGHLKIIEYLIVHGATMRRKDCSATLLNNCAELSDSERIERTQSLLENIEFNMPSLTSGVSNLSVKQSAAEVAKVRLEEKRAELKANLKR